VALVVDAEDEEPTWTSAVMADWAADEAFVERRAGDAAQGEGYLRIGDGKQPGAGMAASQRIPLQPGDLCTITWQARTHTTEQNYILCLRLFDEDGEDVTAIAAAPEGWQHTPYSNAHYHVGFSNTKPDTWEQFSCDYVVPDPVASAWLSLRVYLGGDLRGDIDDLRVTVKPSAWSEERPVPARVSQTKTGPVQDAQVADEALRFVTRFEQQEDHLSARVRVMATDPERARRCLRVLYRLPLELAGWTWSADPRAESVIEPRRKHEDAVAVAGHPLSRYPLASIRDDSVGLAIATPLDAPALQSFHAGPDGFVTTVDLGLSPEAPNAQATFTLVLYRHDPAWGFRAALERYYALFPALFEGKTQRGGCWTLRMPDPEVESPEDFGLAFYECGVAGTEAREYCRAHDLATLRYIEPWGTRQTFPEAESRADLPPYEDRLAQVQTWAQEPDSDARWLGAPRNVMAQVVLNSMLIGPEGIAAFHVDKYTHWAQWWQLNTDPDLPSPNRAEMSLQYRIEPALEWADGIYVDSVSFRRAGSEDHAAAHFAAASCPLGFSLKTGTPVVLSAYAHCEFLEWLRDYLHERDKLLMFNLFPPATRLYGHLADIAGCELSGPQNDGQAMQQRIYAYHRPLSNLLQWRFSVLKRAPAMTPEEMENYFANQLFYGFWPGISTAGGGTEEGYRHMHRYFRSPELYERDRTLFKRYIPVFDALNEAGWEPVTHARSDRPEVWVERFGGTGGTAYLTVRNSTDEAQEATLALERGWWAEALSGRGEVTLTRVLAGASCDTTVDGDSLLCPLRLKPRATQVLRVEGN